MDTAALVASRRVFALLAEVSGLSVAALRARTEPVREQMIRESGALLLNHAAPQWVSLGAVRALQAFVDSETWAGAFTGPALSAAHDTARVWCLAAAVVAEEEIEIAAARAVAA